MMAHEKASGGMDNLVRGLASHFREPASIEDWHWAMSLNQARAVALGIEHWRSLGPDMLVWQLNDCWPVISWSALDSEGRRKPLWYALRKSFQDRLLTIQPRNDRLVVVAVNDSADPWSGPPTWSAVIFRVRVLAQATASLHAAPSDIHLIPLSSDVANAGDPLSEVLVVSCGPDRALWFFGEDRDLSLPRHDLETSIEPVEGGWLVRVRAAALQRDVVLLADKVGPDAVVDEMLLTLLAGEPAVIRIQGRGIADVRCLVSPKVLRSANQPVSM